MKLKGLWITLLVLAILGVCGLIAAVGWFTLDRFSTGANLPLSQVFSGEMFANANFSAEVDESQVFPVGKEPLELIIENTSGNIYVQGNADADQIAVKLHKTAWDITQEKANTRLGQLTYEVIELPGKLTIRVNQNGMQYSGRDSIDFNIDLPRNTPLQLKTDAGDINVSNMQADVQVNAAFGNIDIKDTQGGAVTVENQNGEVLLRSVLSEKEPVTVSSSFGSIKIVQLTAGEMEVGSSNGAIELQNIKTSGALTLSNDFGDVTVRDSQLNDLHIEAQNGAINLQSSQVEQQIFAHSDFGSIDLKDALAAEYDIELKNGKITLNGARDAVIKAVSDFGEIELSNIEQAQIDLNTKNGSIIFRGSLTQERHTVSSDFGNITLRFPPTQSLSCDLSTEFGTISSEFDFTMTGTLSEKHWVGKLNQGGGSLTADTQNGNVTLEQGLAKE